MPELLPANTVEDSEPSNNLPLAPANTDLDAVKSSYQTSLMSLTEQKAVFAKAMVDNGGDAVKAFELTTYDPSKKRAQIKRLMGDSGVLTAIKLGQLIDYYDNGFPLSWKRQRLQQVITVCSDPEREEFNPAGVNSCMRLLSELDGNINKNNGLGITQIVINTGITR